MIVTYNIRVTWIDRSGNSQYRQVLISADESDPIDAVAGEAADIVLQQGNESPGMAGGIDAVGVEGITGVSEGHREGAYVFEGE